MSFLRSSTLIFIIILLVSLGSPQVVYGFPVSALPEDNLVSNPWFRKLSNPTVSSLDGWTDAAGLNKYWSSSQKESNPSPEIVVSGVCGKKQVYCGTAARLSPTPGQSGGLAEAEVDSYLHQVVTADPNNRKLRFFTHWVSHKVDIAEVIISGSRTANGPWTQVWVPFSVVLLELPPRPESGERADEWNTTNLVETIIPEGFPYYKIEIHVRFPESTARIGDIGFKITGVYFTAAQSKPGETVSLASTVEPTQEPTQEEITSPKPTRTRENNRRTPTSEPTPSLTPTIPHTGTPEPASTQVALLSTEPAAQPSLAPTLQFRNDDATQPDVQSENNPANSPLNSLNLIALTTGLVILLAWVVLRRLRRP